MDIARAWPKLAPSNAVPSGQDRARRWVLAALVAVLILQLPVVFLRAINWDEFYHYSLVVKLAKGTLDLPLQTLYTQPFVWVTALPGAGVDHVILIRIFMLACELVALACIAGMAARFTDRTTGLLCALAYLSASFIFRHGTSFRFDPPAAALLMGSAWLFTSSHMRASRLALAAILAGISTVLTIKTVLYAPVFAGIAWMVWTERGRRRADLVRLAALAVGVVVCAGVVYLLHAASLAAGGGGQAESLFSNAGRSMFTLSDPFGYRRFILWFAISSPLLAIPAFLAPFAIWRSNSATAHKIALTGLWLPLTTLFFYQNTAPYYYVFMMPPVAVAASPLMAVLARRYGAALIAGAMLACAAFVLATEPESTLARQRQIQQEAKRLFPDGVAYFDSCAMLGSFPKANVFMTPWVLSMYRQGIGASMEETMTQRTVPLLLNDDAVLGEAVASEGDVSALLPQDVVALRDTYIPFWGPFWLAGREISGGMGAQTWNVRVPGVYTVREGRVVIDGREFAKGDRVTLARGQHRLSAPQGDARLVWGDRLAVPASVPPQEPYFMPF